VSAETPSKVGSIPHRVRKLSVSSAELRDVKGTSGGGACPDGACRPKVDVGGLFDTKSSVTR
jgi:hypothetical protein